jgi:ABC-type nitrate/sulfonate/bicarbonate transport system permease component
MTAMTTTATTTAAMTVPPRRDRARPRGRDLVRASALGLVGVGVLLAAWTIAARRLANPILLPVPRALLGGFLEIWRDGTLARDVAASLKRVVLGFLVASATAIPLALAMVSSRVLRQVASPVLGLLRPIPPIAWIPIAILWFGLGDRPSYFVTAVAAFFPVFVNALAGATAVEPQHLRAAQCLGAGRWALLRYVYLPSALPSIFTGLKIGLGQSWMAVVTAELVAAQSGLGYMIELNRLQLETPRVFVGMLVIAVVGALMTLSLSGIEIVIFPWKPARQSARRR